MNVFITGASSGIGAALARAYRARHPQANIGLVARRPELLSGLAADLGLQCCAYWALDVRDRDAMQRAASEFQQRFGLPDVVVAGAGISHGTLTGAPADAPVFDRIVDTNLTGTLNTFAPFVPAMRDAGRGCLVGIGSLAAVRGMPGAGAYSASKAGVVAYLESLRLELRANRVSVVTISPGFIRTPMTAGNRYRMPFLIDADVFAGKAIEAIEARRSFVVIPWQMRIVAAGLRLLPDVLFDAFFANAPRKERIDGGQCSDER